MVRPGRHPGPAHLAQTTSLPPPTPLPPLTDEQLTTEAARMFAEAAAVAVAGQVRRGGAGSWVLAQDQAELELAPAAGVRVSAEVEVPKGWIKPVNVLRFEAPPARRHLLATVLQPRAAGAPSLGTVRMRREGGLLTVSIGGDELTFAASGLDWLVENVKLAAPAAAPAPRAAQAPPP